MVIEPKRPVARSGHVLVVEDDHDMRELLRDFLQDEGYTVGEASDGEAALDLLRATPTRWVVLTDRFMPRLSGPELMAALVADPQLRARHTVIYMTAAERAVEPDVQRLLDVLDAPVLRKPFPLDLLAATVAAATARLAAATT